MPLGCCWIELHVPAAASLKDKRRVVKSILDRLRARFNVSASEMEEQDLWQRAVLAVACVSSSKTLISQTFEKVRRSVENQGDCYVTRFETEFL
jgi:uncharacterized protein